MEFDLSVLLNCEVKVSSGKRWWNLVQEKEGSMEALGHTADGWSCSAKQNEVFE